MTSNDTPLDAGARDAANDSVRPPFFTGHLGRQYFEYKQNEIDWGGVRPARSLDPPAEDR